MAVDTLLAHEALMRIILDVAGQAVGRRIPIFFLRRVTICATDIQVSADQREVGEIVIERRFIEHHDLRIAAFMIGMAAGAGLGSGICRPAMKPSGAPDVGTDILMAVDAKLRLCLAVEHDMT